MCNPWQINKKNYENILVNVLKVEKEKYKRVSKHKITDTDDYEAVLNRRRLEKNIFDKNVESVVESSLDKLTYPFLEEKELDFEGKNSNFQIQNFSESSKIYLEGTNILDTSDFETNISDITCINRVKSMRHIIKDNKNKLKNTKLNKITNTNNINSKNELYLNKTTYCQPAVGYNQECVNKTIEKNYKLKKIVQNLLISRQQEKSNVIWNNYINELKNKHSSISNGLRPIISIPDYKSQIDHKITEGVTNTAHSCERSLLFSNSSKYLLEGNNMSKQFQYIQSQNKQLTPQKESKYIPFESNLISYPTCSRGRLIMLEQEKQRIEGEMKRRQSSKINNSSNTSVKQLKSLEKSFSTNKYKNLNTRKLVSTSNQTDFFVLQGNNSKNLIWNSKSTNVKNDAHDIAENTEFNNRIIYNFNNNSLTSFGNKLENLIESINNFINEVKNRNVAETKCVSVSCKIDHKFNKSDIKMSASIGSTRSKNAAHKQGSTSIASDVVSKLNHVSSGEFLNKLLTHCINKTPKGCKSLEKNFIMQNKLQCSVPIQSEIPTRDCCIEVTKSLTQQAVDDKDETKKITHTMGPNHLTTIAINTDPLSVFSLLRISTNAIMNILSYVPNINYYGYLSMLQFPKVLKRQENRHVCKACGASFHKSSELIDHIQSHNLKTRDCCVCRHMIQRPRWPTCLFICQYCGQKFTRAYCCDLHEQTCATRLGTQHDVSQSLSILQ